MAAQPYQIGLTTRMIESENDAKLIIFSLTINSSIEKGGTSTPIHAEANDCGISRVVILSRSSEWMLRRRS